MFTLTHPAALSELPRILEGQTLVKVTASRKPAGASKALLRLEFERATLEVLVPFRDGTVETDYIMPQVLEAGGADLTESGVM